MTAIQHSLIDTQQVSFMSPVKQSDNYNDFEAMLDAVGLEKILKPDDLNNLIEESEENLPTLQSDICVREQTLATHSLDVMMREAAHSEQIKSTPVNLTRDNVQKVTSVDILVLKKSSLKTVEIDGTEVDPSLMIPLVPIDVRPNSVTLISYELKKNGEPSEMDLGGNDSQNPSINLSAIEAHAVSINPTYVEIDSRESVNDDVRPALDHKEELAREVTKETPLSLSFSKESASHDHAAELMPTVQSMSGMANNPAITLRPTPSKMTREIQSNDDRMMDEVPIVSIALKRDPVMREIPLKKSGLDLKPENENLVLDQIDVPQTKILNDVVQLIKDTETDSDSFQSDFEGVEPLLESPAKEADLKQVSSAVPTEPSEITTEANISKSAPAQQIQQAILDEKEGMSPKESKTLTVVLNPEELGVVNVELTADKTGKLSAVLSVEKRETLDVLQHDLHQLKAVLKEIGIDESSISLQLSSNNEQGQQKQSEYVAWEEREQMLMRSPQIPIKTVAEKATYPERQSLRRLDIKA